MSGTPHTLTLDPVAMNVVNRIAAGSRLDGQLQFEGGLLVQGELSGNCEVRGRLIVWQGAQVCGRIRVMGDLYLLGRLGQPDAPPAASEVECHGTAWIASTGVSTATLRAQRLQLYEGADLQGPFHTLRPAARLPVLDDALTDHPADAP